MDRQKESKKLFSKAKKILVGGVNSPVRSFSHLDHSPFYITSARKSVLYTCDGIQLIDFCCSWGALILGHVPEKVLYAVRQSIKNGFSFGFNHESEIIFAKEIIKAIPSVEKLRLVNSGTEAVMTAIRLARGFTGKTKILKFEGCYHGHSDSMLVEAGSGLLTFGKPSSKGISKSFAKDTLICPFNDFNSLQKLIQKHKNSLAALIIEPVAGNMGVIPSNPSFLKKLRKITSQNNIILIFDEVITGFRFTSGGFQNLINVKPDLTCLGKIIGGGFPLAALGGKTLIMKHLAPTGDVYQAGTLSGNPIAVSAGLATILELKKTGFYSSLNQKGSNLISALKNIFNESSIPITVQGKGSMFTVFCQNTNPENLKDLKKCDLKRFSRMHLFFQNHGILLPPSQFEACFISSTHKIKQINLFISVMKLFLKEEEKSHVN